MILQSNNLYDYLPNTYIIDYDNEIIVNKCRRFKKYSNSNIELIDIIYKFVRDDIKHSADIGLKEVPTKASEVLKIGHGICHAKSNLLAAMLRFFNIPVGFCYQKLCSDEDVNIKLLHCLNAVYVDEYNKWIRIDARGNKEGIIAEFSIEEEKIAWPVKKEMGEKDFQVIYTQPNKKIIKLMQKSKNRVELWKYLEFDKTSSADSFGLE